MTRRRWIADRWDREHGTAFLLGAQAMHLARVLRAEPGQIFDVVAGGFLHRAEVLSVCDGEVAFALHEEMEAEESLPLHLVLAVFKFDHFEWAVEKATELGVARVTPVLARRTDKHLIQASAKRLERWRRIVHEAAQQSRRTNVPVVDEPLPLHGALAVVKDEWRILMAETEQENSLRQVLQRFHEGASKRKMPLAIAIGPEGGWTAEEMGDFSAADWKFATLGPRILRAETAAIAALAICGSLYLDG